MDGMNRYREAFSVTADDSTYVELTSRYDSPTDSAVGELCNPIYQAALKGLREHFS